MRGLSKNISPLFQTLSDIIKNAMERKLTDIVLQNSHRGRHKGNWFLVPVKCFGKEGTRLYKVFGFDGDDVYAQRINKRTGKIPGNAPILENFKFDEIYPNG